MATVEDLDAALVAFDEQFRRLTRPRHENISFESLRATRFGKGAEWAECAGAYVMIDCDTPRYVGRALKGSGLRARLMEHVRGNDQAVRDLIARKDTSVLVIPLDNEDAWMAPSLELFLHWKLRDDGLLLNKKRS